MNKLIRRIATMGASIAVVGGTVLAAEGSASAVVLLRPVVTTGPSSPSAPPTPATHPGSLISWHSSSTATAATPAVGITTSTPGHDHSERREL